MTTVPDGTSLHSDDPTLSTAAPQGLWSMLPARAAVLDRLTERMPATDTAPASLVTVGLRRRDDGWPVPPGALDEITTLLARGLRTDDWLARCGPTEFVVLVPGPTAAGQGAAARLVDSIDAAAIRDMTAAAGVAALAPGLSAGEALRRATLCLATARTIGAGRVITYSGTR